MISPWLCSPQSVVHALPSVAFGPYPVNGDLYQRWQMDAPTGPMQVVAAEGALPVMRCLGLNANRNHMGSTDPRRRDRAVGEDAAAGGQSGVHQGLGAPAEGQDSTRPDARAGGCCWSCCPAPAATTAVESGHVKSLGERVELSLQDIAGFKGPRRFFALISSSNTPYNVMIFMTCQSH